MLLDHRKKQNESADEEQEFSEVIREKLNFDFLQKKKKTHTLYANS